MATLKKIWSCNRSSDSLKRRPMSFPPYSRYKEFDMKDKETLAKKPLRLQVNIEKFILKETGSFVNADLPVNGCTG